MTVADIAQLVWYVTGRFYADGKMLQDSGYFLHLQGIEAPLFDGTPSESTAYFTFSSEPFGASTVPNGGLSIGIDKRGAFSLYLRDEPGASFDDPKTFADGQCIGTFERMSIVATAEAPGIGLFSNVFSATLVSSEPFEFRGRRYDLRELIGHGITQWGLASAPAGTTGSPVPFVGSAIRAA